MEDLGDPAGNFSESGQAPLDPKIDGPHAGAAFDGPPANATPAAANWVKYALHQGLQASPLVALAGAGGAELLRALGGGTGTHLLEVPEGSNYNQRQLQRINLQDQAVLLMLLIVYHVTLAIGLSLTYRMAMNASPVRYYAFGPDHHFLCEGADAESFLEAFNQSPKSARLQVTGFVPSPEGLESVIWRGQGYLTVFSFSLDLSPWVVRYPSTADATPGGSPRFDSNGLREGDAGKLQAFLERDSGNALAQLELQKHVEWPGWEDIATNIKHRIRQQGFSGLVTVTRTDADSVRVLQNKSWANFMHDKTTRILALLSVTGAIFYFPYMWLRCRTTVVRSRFVVDMSIAEYWSLIADNLSADGFEARA